MTAMEETAEPDRRRFLASASSAAMAGGLVLGYGTCGAMGARYLFPARERQRAWLYVATVESLGPGESVSWRAPTGERIAIARQGAGSSVEDFVALGSTCPHLGCQVHWEPQNDRFFCPCHNGVFTPAGKGIGGPPGDAGQDLPRYPLRIEQGLLYIEVPVEGLLARATDAAGAAGHDPCLAARPRVDDSGKGLG